MAQALDILKGFGFKFGEQPQDITPPSFTPKDISTFMAKGVPEKILDPKPLPKPEIERPLPTLGGAVFGPFELASKAIGAILEQKPITEAREVFEIAREKAQKIPIIGKIPGIPFVLGMVAEGPLFGGGKKRAVTKTAEAANSLKSLVKNLIKEKFSNINKAYLDSENFVRGIETALSKVERQAIPFLRQGVKDIKALTGTVSDDVISAIKNPTQKMKVVLKAVNNYYDEAFEELSKNFDEVGYVDKYVTQIWDIPKKQLSQVRNFFTTKNPFLKKRTIPSLEEGIAQGLKPKTTDVAELLRLYDSYKINSIHNLRFAKGLTKLSDDVGEALIKRIDKAPTDWVTVNHPALNRAIGTTLKEGQLLISKVPVKVHPDIAREVKVIFDQPFSGKGVKALETVNAFLKKSLLSLSFFHHFALSESALSSGIGRQMFKMWNPVKIYKALRNKEYEIFKRIPAAKDAIEHGVVFGALPDVHVMKVQKALKSLENLTKRIPIVRNITTGVRGFNDLWDRALWDYYHNSLKLFAYEAQIGNELKRLKTVTPELVQKIKNQVGQFVNDSFGGQNWDELLVNPKMRQVMQWAFLAPDWSISVLRQASAPVRGLLKKEASLARQSTKFWMRAALYYNMVIQPLNYFNTKRDFGEGKFTWENDPDNKMNIYWKKDEQGRKIYVRVGKQFREVLDWATAPLEVLGRKVSPVVRESMRQLTEHDPGGFPVEEIEDKEGLEKALGRVESIIKTPIPLSVRQSLKGDRLPISLALPTRFGMTPFSTREEFKKAIQKKDLEQIRTIWRQALENNLDAKGLFTQTKAALKSDITFEAKDEASIIILEIKRINKARGEEAGRSRLQELRDSGVITDKIEAEIIKLLKREKDVEKQKQKADVR